MPCTVHANSALYSCFARFGTVVLKYVRNAQDLDKTLRAIASLSRLHYLISCRNKTQIPHDKTMAELKAKYDDVKAKKRRFTIEQNKYIKKIRLAKEQLEEVTTRVRLDCATN